jgi:hypothetical protein
MFVQREDIEYMLHDFLEIKYGANELENTRIVQFLMERIKPAPKLTLCPVYGFLAGGVLLSAVSIPGRLRVRESLTLNQKTRGIVHHSQMNAVQGLTW